MPAKPPNLTDDAEAQLRDLGARIRARRKALGVNAVTLAETAGMSRVTVYRIEKGNPSVTMGAYVGVIQALGLTLYLSAAGEQMEGEPDAVRTLPLDIALDRYPVLRQLAWQVDPARNLAPAEAHDIYRRNARFVDDAELSDDERALIRALDEVFERSR